MTDTLDPPAPPPDRAVTPVDIEKEMATSYLDYAMSVIVSRALPDARDGLKPVHRRILFGMDEAGYHHDRPYRKAARVVGDVMGKYHPHGDQAIYDAMVRMAQDFSMRLPLIDGQGNFGSMDGDPPAAMRYTEVRLDRAARALLDDIDRDTVDFQANYDDTAREPTVLPARIPNLLVNGAGGIAVGMATNIPPHNLGELIDACFAYLDDRDIDVDGLMAHVRAPDFPTGALILGDSGARQAYATGRGSIVMRARTHVEDAARDRQAIVVTEIPYQVNKARMIEQIAEVARDKRVEGIVELRDESDRQGIRVVIEIRREANAEIVLNQLYRHTPLQTNFAANMLALDRGRPETLNLKSLIAAFVDFRQEVVTRRTRFDLDKARERAEILVGLAAAVANIDAVIALIRAAPDPASARASLMGRDWPAEDIAELIDLIDDPGRGVVDGRYRLSEAQARAVLELRLQRLTALGRDEIDVELRDIAARIVDYLEILRSRTRLYEVVRGELEEVRDRLATPRRSAVVEAAITQDDEDLVQREDMVLTVSHSGYIKRVPLSTYRVQQRGGRGRTGMSTRQADFVTQMFVVDTHTPLLFFSTAGRVYRKKTWMLPAASPQARGKAMVNLLPLAAGETIATLMPCPETRAERAGRHIMFATARGYVRRNSLDDFENIQSVGKIAMKLDPGDRIVAVRICTEDDDVLLSARGGKCLRFHTGDVRLFKGRSSQGVRGMRLAADDEVISMSILRHVELATEERDAYFRRAGRQRREEPGAEAVGDAAPARAEALADGEEFILAVTENGYGKRTSAYQYRTARRGGQGIINIETSKRNGPVVNAFPVAAGDQIMLITDGGRLIRVGVEDIRVAGRNTQGVTLFKTGEDERVVSVAWLPDGEAGAANGAPAAPRGGGLGGGAETGIDSGEED